MIYLLENEYTRKLYNFFKSTARLISKTDLINLDQDTTLVLDEVDLPCFEQLKISINKVIVLGDSQVGDSDAFTYVSKYQSYKNIFKRIYDSNFPVYLLSSSKISDFSPDLIKRIATRIESDYIVSLNYSDSSAFSLYDCISEGQFVFERGEINEIMTNFYDYLKPPSEDIIKLIGQLQKKGPVLLVSTPLKGALDLALLKHSNTLFWFGDVTSSNFVNDLKKTNPQLQIEFLQSSQF